MICGVNLGYCGLKKRECKDTNYIIMILIIILVYVNS